MKIMVSVAQLVEPRVVIPVVVGSSPIVHPIIIELICYKQFVRVPKSVILIYNANQLAKVAELVDALDLGSSGVTCESSSLSFRTKFLHRQIQEVNRCKFRLKR